MDEQEYDVVVVGGGAAGLSAALVLARARRRVVVVDGGEPRNAPAAHVHGFLSRDGTPPADLLRTGRAEVTSYGGEVVEDRVTAIEPAGSAADGEAAAVAAGRGPVRDGDAAGSASGPGGDGAGGGAGGVPGGVEPGFVVGLAGGRRLAARRVLLTTGLRDELPDVPGVRELWGSDVLHCPYCHGWEVRDQPLGLLAPDPPPAGSGASGATPSAALTDHALLVRQWSPDLVLFPRGVVLDPVDRQRLAARGVRVEEGDVVRLVVRDGRLRGVELADRVVTRSAVFVTVRFVGHDQLLTRLGCAVGESGWVATDASGRTSVDGVWAAGNVVDPRAQVITAAAQGGGAAAAINADLVQEDGRRALRGLEDCDDAVRW